MTKTIQPKNLPFELKSGSISVPVLRIFSKHFQVMHEDLAAKIEQAPGLFRNAPLILDVQELAEPLQEEELHELLALLRSLSMAPVGLRGGGALLQSAVANAGLALLADVRHGHDTGVSSNAATPSEHRPVASKPSTASAGISSKIIDQPVRSGQRIYANGCDLIVLAQVSAGAEIIADGNIHVYGSLRGRALAGAQGDEGSRIFCRDLQAELISVAGQYRVSEQLMNIEKNRATQIFLRDNTLIIEYL